MHLTFKQNEWLTETQIQQFFARLAAKQRSQDPTKEKLTKDQLANAEVPDEEVADTLNYIQAVSEVQTATEIEQELELDDDIDYFHPFIVEGLRLCVLAKDMKQCSVFQKSKLFKVKKGKLVDAVKKIGIDLPAKAKKEKAGEALVNFIEENCDCLTFVE